MEAGHPVSLLMFGTLVVAILIAVILFARFMRKRRNRHPMAGQPERNIDDIRREGPE